MRSQDELDRVVADHERRLRKTEDGVDYLRRARDDDKIEAGRMIESIEKIVKEATGERDARLENLEKNLAENTKATGKILIEVEASGKERERRTGADDLRKQLDADREKLIKWMGGIAAIAATLAGIYKIIFH